MDLIRDKSGLPNTITIFENSFTGLNKIISVDAIATWNNKTSFHIVGPIMCLSVFWHIGRVLNPPGI